MNSAQVIYSISVEDILTVSSELEIEFTKEDLSFLEDKIGNSIDWHSAIEFALEELREERAKTEK